MQSKAPLIFSKESLNFAVSHFSNTLCFFLQTVFQFFMDVSRKLCYTIPCIYFLIGESHL